VTQLGIQLAEGSVMTRGQSGRLKKRFLEAFAEMGNISRACSVAGVHRQRVYEWQEHDEEFAREFRLAELHSTERLEAEAYRRAHDGVLKEKPIYQMSTGVKLDTIIEREYSDTLLIFLLKARNPGKYRDKAPEAPGGRMRYTLDEVRRGLGLDE
jgi:hypothetical protein